MRTSEHQRCVLARGAIQGTAERKSREKKAAAEATESIAVAEAEAEAPPPSAVVDSWGEVVGGEISGDVDVGAGLGGDRGALISQLVRPFVLLYADVGPTRRRQ